MKHRRTWWLVLVLLLLGVAAAAKPLASGTRAALMLQSLSAPAHFAEDELSEDELVIAGRSGPIRARLYRASGAAARPGVVLAHGVHYRGIDEPRLVRFARELARAGRTVLTPELAELADYRITSRGTDSIADSVLWLSAQRELVSDERVAAIGFSFAGGLLLVAAADPELTSKLESVTSVGGHHDLKRVLQFLLSGQTPTPRGLEARKAHDYGLVVLLHGELEHFVEPEDRELMADALRLWLHEDRAAATARASQRTTESGERLFLLLQQGRLGQLAPELAKRLEQREPELVALSPRGQLGRIGVPVYLLHGSGDCVIPPSEAEWAELELRGRPHQTLVTPLLEHVEVSGTAGLLEQAKLAQFMARLM